MIKNIIIVMLVLQTYIIAKNYKGAEYRTKEAYTYGRFEANYKSVQKDGILSTFFTYHDEGLGWNEIDIEILGRYSDEVQFNTITPGQTNHVRAHYVDFNPAEDYHTYAFEWTPEYVAWFIDDQEVYRQTGEYIQTLVHPQKIMMNIWNPIYANWVGVWNENILPAFAYYDWVSYYSYTPGSGNYGTNNNFTHQWTDNFDTWDQSRWAKATHTFNGNNCDFLPENVVFDDGKLILCLTDKTNIGYTDINPPFLLWSRATEGTVFARFSEELNETSAENTSVYLISNVTVNSAELLNDKITVKLSVTGLDLSKGYNLIVLSGIEDLHGNVNSSKAITIKMPAQVSFPIKINVGGEAIDDYLADQEWSENVEYGYLDGEKRDYGSAIQINNTEEDGVFQSERNGMVMYGVRVPNGTYKINLMMAENHFNKQDDRIFDVYIEGKPAGLNIDVFKQAGKNSAFILEADNISVTDEVIDIHFAAKTDRALLNGLVVESISTGVNEIEREEKSFELFQNYPNPFNGMTRIDYYLPSDDIIFFKVYDMLGQLLYSKNFGLRKQGMNNIIYNASDNNNRSLSTGVYIYSISGTKFSSSRKFLLLN